MNREFSRAALISFFWYLWYPHFGIDRADCYRCRTSLRFIVSFVLIAMLSACGDEGTEAARASQVVARVNGTELTVHQLEHELAQRAQHDATKPDTDEVVEELINRELFVQKAHEAKLDRTPEAVLAFDRARAQILSEMYLKAVVTHAAQPGEAEVRDYYAQHPELFATRRVYQFKQFELIPGVTVEQAEAWRRSVQDKATLESHLNKLAKLERVIDRTLAAEALPLDFVLTAHTLKTGDTAVMKAGKDVSILLLQGVTPEPITLTQAAPHIAQFLVNQRERQVINDEIARLRQVSRVDRLRTPADRGPQTAVAAEAVPLQQQASEIRPAPDVTH